MKHYVLTISVLPILFLAGCTPTTRDTGTQQTSVNNEQGSSEDAMKDESHIKGVVMIEGKMMTIWDGYETEAMAENMQFKSGLTVMMDGTVKTAEGQTIQLHNGDVILMDGTMKKASDLGLKMMKEGTDEDKAQDGAMMKNDEGAAMKKEDTMMKAGEYKDFTATALPASVLADGKTKVLFFHASWCPICKTANQTLTSWYVHGEGMLTVYKINYDTEKSLEQKYGVTYQHTFVKVDGKGNLIKLMTGPSDDELKALLKS